MTKVGIFLNNNFLMATQIQPKQIITLVLSIMLAIGSCWIPLSPNALIRNPESSKRVAQSTPVELGIFARNPVKARRFR